MPRQRGLVKIEGTLGDVTFFKTQDGYMVKEKTVINGQRIKTDHAFQRTRENMAEFGRAGKASKTLRQAFNTLLMLGRDKRVVSRLTAEMVKVVKADTTNARGKREVLDAETEMLVKFPFNINANLFDIFKTGYTTSIVRATGVTEVVIPPFIPQNSILAPIDATHYRFVSAASEIDFQNEWYNTVQSESAIAPIDNVQTQQIKLTNTVTATSTHPLFLIFGIQFFQEVSGDHYPLKSGVYNPLNIANINGV